MADFPVGDRILQIDEDGFIRITGRISRFSKIGGEMVPHIGVEEALAQALVDGAGPRVLGDQPLDHGDQAVRRLLGALVIAPCHQPDHGRVGRDRVGQLQAVTVEIPEATAVDGGGETPDHRGGSAHSDVDSSPPPSPPR